ncbi:ralBP1-associated Eps domain-containing protein 1-like protein [Dinothrombium tinctorium]|uniref:RalBP1-associated Eps domain-containing protein 1-like protein n=1 Tax=Dinothrombium tinctorium TaxID=1965070 RepID=A0A443RAJ8_9ACAR|nr:ralBP1-associated Eps domain-containing protein 1-like protein [Dinothrombium tinctorium]
MDALNLSESEREFYGELFANLDVDNEARISLERAIDYISHCQLPHDVIEKIIDLCGAKRLGHFGRSQFYIAMKLIACAQSGIPLNADALAINKNIPLPMFNAAIDNEKLPIEKRPVKQVFKEQLITKHGSAQRLNSESCHLPPPPPTKGNRQRLGNMKSSESTSSPLASIKNLSIDNCDISFKKDSNSSDSSPETIPSTKSDSKISSDKWVEFPAKTSGNEVTISWDYGEEGRHLLGNEEDSSDRGHSSDDEDDDGFDIWLISKEQKEYYMKQFKSLEVDSNGKLSGRVAKEFFEKSKLPQNELSKIWKLSDVDKDGALTCEEFCTAMHLVVLRRNNVELPDFLPTATLVKNHQNNSHITPTGNIPDPNALSPQNKQWTKFSDSPTNQIISVSSPPNSSTSSSSGMMQPANFDFNAASIEKDPKILHPVAVRVSPDGQRVPYVSCDAFIGANTMRLPIEMTCNSSLSPNFCARKDPPPPPPRPKVRGHARSSSLDLNRISKAQETITSPIVSQLADYSPVSPNLSNVPTYVEHRGAFTVYRKTEPQTPARNWADILRLKYQLPVFTSLYSDSDDPAELKKLIRSLQQRIFYLENVYSDLIQELANALETNCNLEANMKLISASK